ncbi:hypothetical protein TRAPUB_6108 [Trametes pubescens]|uniref:Uncharacterized protein n=1 Tax=Trametes pubescens TaxID=154538 RepID=A0A1M2V6S0_TRAPU|nr:hypothetical protein TRAPUB_6108 [Trametes pubescens]
MLGLGPRVGALTHTRRLQNALPPRSRPRRMGLSTSSPSRREGHRENREVPAEWDCCEKLGRGASWKNALVSRASSSRKRDPVRADKQTDSRW